MTLTLAQPRSIRPLNRQPLPTTEAINVLLLTEACEPFGTPESRLGYELSRALARSERLEVTIVTHDRNRKSLEKQPIDAGRGRLARVIFVDSPRIDTRRTRLGTVFQRFGTILNDNDPCDTNATCAAFERAVQRRFKNDLAKGRFDVIHHLTPAFPPASSSFPSLTDIPTLVGPVTNGHFKPTSYQDDANRLERLRHWVPSLRLGREPEVAGIIAGSREVLADLPDGGPRRFYLPDVELEPERFPMIQSWRAPSTGAGFRFVTAGPLVPGMSIDWVIRAMGASRILRGCQLTVIGEGPELPNLKALVGELGLRSSVEFVGWLDNRGVKGCLQGSQAFVFPSGSESDGGTIVEAMAAALPVIVRDQGEAREIVGHSNGIRLPHDHPEGLLNSIRQTMERLATDYPLCERLGKAGSRRARETFSWPAKAGMLVRFYENVIETKLASNLNRIPLP